MRGSARLDDRFRGALLLFGCALLAACGSSGGRGRSGTGGHGDSGTGEGRRAAAAAGSGNGRRRVTGTGGVLGTGGGAGTGGAGGAGKAGTGGSSAGGATEAGTGGSSAGSGGAARERGPSAGCGATNSSRQRHYMITSREPPRVHPHAARQLRSRHPYRLILAFHGQMYTAQSVADGGPPGSGPYYGIESEAEGQRHLHRAAGDRQRLAPSDRDFGINTMVSSIGGAALRRRAGVRHRLQHGRDHDHRIGCGEGTSFARSPPCRARSRGGARQASPWPTGPRTATSDPTIPIASGQAARDKFDAIDHCSADDPRLTPMAASTLGCTRATPYLVSHSTACMSRRRSRAGDLGLSLAVLSGAAREPGRAHHGVSYFLVVTSWPRAWPRPWASARSPA